MGPLFRQERPQKGRQRQFHQFGVEAFGSANPEQDAEDHYNCMAYIVTMWTDRKCSIESK